MGIKKVLVACPISEHKEYCSDFFINQLKTFDYSNYDILLVDNSNGFQFRNRIKEQGINVIHKQRKNKAPNEFILESMNTIRDYFLKGDYDFLFILESDVFVSKDTISYMVAFNLPVHNITYSVTVNGVRRLCLQTRNSLIGGSRLLSPELSNEVMTGEVKPFKDYVLDGDTTLIASGYGCTMIMREVIQYVKFRIDKTNDQITKQHTFPDSFFHADLDTLGIANYLNTERIAQHYNSTW